MNRTPPWLLAATLLFWGWQTKHWYIAATAAALVESPRWIRRRWEFSAGDLSRMWDFTSVLLVAGFILSYATTWIEDGVIGFARWLPMVFMPFLITQLYSERNVVTLRTFSILLRRSRAASAIMAMTPVDFSFPYLGLVVMATSGANVRGLGFYLGLCAIAAWSLWQLRNRSITPVGWLSMCTWAAAFAIVAGAGFVGQIGLHHLQLIVEDKAAAFFTDMDVSDPNRWQSRTSIGDIGFLKASSRIVLRVKPLDGSAPPTHLREATYNVFRTSAANSTWQISERDFRMISSDPDRNTQWTLLDEKPAGPVVSISRWLHRGLGVLALPNGTWRIEHLPATVVERNPFGTVRASAGSDLIHYVARYGPGATIDAPPGEYDRTIPSAEVPGLAQASMDFGLAGKPDSQKIQLVTDFFAKHFTYSRHLTGSGSGAWGPNAPVSEFLLKTRRGHCEYFATATVLLLRQAGIPARYATGYSVQESGKNGLYVVRARHAHAWCLAYVDGEWRDVDTTPASWVMEEEDAAVSAWNPLSDFFSNLWYRFSAWRWEADKTGFKRVVMALAVVVVLALIWKYLPQRKQWMRRSMAMRKDGGPRKRDDFALLHVERELGACGLGRRPDETWREWQRRVERSPLWVAGTPSLDPMVSLHYRDRFDPNGLSDAERGHLDDAARAWVEESRRERMRAEG